jgi:polar amino acid transport system substrate-binding protein
MRNSLRAVLLLVLLGGLPVAAQTVQPVPPVQAAPLRVAVFVVPPFVIKSANGYTGFSMELWQRVAAELHLSYQTQEVGTVSDLLAMVRDGRADVGVSSLTITAERFATVDFSQPYFDSGLRIMIDEDRHASMGSMMTALHRSGHLRVYAWLGGLIIIATVVLTLVDRKYDPEFPQPWYEGFAEAFHHVMSVATSGSTSHRNLFGVPGRILSSLWLACGVAVVAYVTSSITSVMTVSQLNHQINGPADLGHKVVGAFPGTTGEVYCRDVMLDVQEFSTMEAAVDALLNNQISAIVRDAPVLEWYDRQHPEQPVTVVGPLFRPEKYGFAFPKGSQLTREVSEVVLRLKDQGLLDQLHARYFGNNME